MKQLLSIISLVLLYTFPNTTTLAVELKQNSNPVLIATYEEDITGDGFNEVIELNGILLSENSNYYHKVWVDIKSPHSEQWKISYKGGYEPTIQFIDLNHDGVKDLFYQSTINYHADTLRNAKIANIPLAKQHYIKGLFKNNFKVEIEISPNIEPKIVDIYDQSAEYVRLGIYDKQGKLLKPTLATVDPAIFETKLISKSKGYGLKSYQQVSGAYRENQLGTIETLWYYEKAEWIILQTVWIPFE